jgi:hypothetical protein
MQALYSLFGWRITATTAPLVLPSKIACRRRLGRIVVLRATGTSDPAGTALRINISYGRCRFPLETSESADGASKRSTMPVSAVALPLVYGCVIVCRLGGEFGGGPGMAVPVAFAGNWRRSDAPNGAPRALLLWSSGVVAAVAGQRRVASREGPWPLGALVLDVCLGDLFGPFGDGVSLLSPLVARRCHAPHGGTQPLLWTADVAWWWLLPGLYARRSPWIGWCEHGFMVFIIFNATVVYEEGLIRWSGLGLLTWIMVPWLLAWTRKTE